MLFLSNLKVSMKLTFTISLLECFNETFGSYSFSAQNNRFEHFKPLIEKCFVVLALLL